MTVTSGFFNSKNHDRVYDATQFSSFFDGLITDGVYQSIGDAFMVSAYSDGNSSVLVGTGRAWFNRTWTVNDTLMLVTLDPPSTLLDRIDAIVLDIDRSEAVRQNSIKVVKGDYSENAQRPTLIHNDTHDQYPLAYVRIPHGDDAPIEQMYISNMVGTSECPLVAGFLESMDITMFIAQMEDKFYDWFEDLQTNLDGDIAANLQNQINKLEEDVADASQGAISLDTLEKAKNVSVSISTISKPSSGGTGNADFHEYFLDMLLPDGYVIDFVLNDTNVGGSSCKLAARLLNPDGVKQSELVIDSSVRDDSLPCILNVTESYPYQISLAIYKPTGVTENTNYDPSGTATIQCSVYTVTVTATHVMTSSKSSKSFTAKNINGAGSYDTEGKLSLRPGVLSDGSYVLCAPFGGDSRGICNIIYKITSDYIVDSMIGTTDFAFGKKDSYGWDMGNTYIFTSDATDVNKRIAIAGYGTNNSTGNVILLNPDTGAIVSTGSSAYETDLISIPVDGVNRIVSNATTIGIYDHKTAPTSTIPVPLSTELSWSLDGSSSFDSWKSGVMDEQGKLLAIGNGSQMRVGVIPDNGLMVWSSPVSGSAFTSSSETMFSLLFPPKASWTTNEEGTVHYILLRGHASLSLNNGGKCPIQPSVSWDWGYSSRLVKIDLGDW